MEYSNQDIIKKISETKGKTICIYIDAKDSDIIKIPSDDKETTYVIIYINSEQKNTIENNIIRTGAGYAGIDFIKNCTEKFDQVYVNKGLGNVITIGIVGSIVKKGGTVFISKDMGKQLNFEYFTKKYYSKLPGDYENFVERMTPNDDRDLLEKIMFETYEIVSLSYPFFTSKSSIVEVMKMTK